MPAPGAKTGHFVLAYVRSSEFGYGYINDVCIGEIDDDTWEIIGPCSEARMVNGD
jgi:hypothetical protein